LFNGNIYIAEIEYPEPENCMPLDGANEGDIVKYMLKHKTDVLTNEDKSKFYTRNSNGWIEIKHPKISHYLKYLNQLEDGTDNKQTWNNYLNRI
jgi:hypothetical protein